MSDYATRLVLPTWADQGSAGAAMSQVHNCENRASLGITGRIAGRMSSSQRIACYVSHVLSVVCIVAVWVWISQDEMGGGGVSWESGDAARVFNWHPVLMVTAFAFMTVASMAFRIKCDGYAKEISHGLAEGRRGFRDDDHHPDHEKDLAGKKIWKILHGIEWTVAALCGFVGIMAVFKANNDGVSSYDDGEEGIGVYVANMFSLHSWIGAVVVLLYVYQFFSAFFSFAIKLSSIGPVRRSRLLSFHRFLGTYIYVFTAASVLLGIQEEEGFVGGCEYSIEDNRPDVTPWIHYRDITRTCKISHGLGLTVFITALIATYALYDFPENQELSHNDSFT